MFIYIYIYIYLHTHTHTHTHTHINIYVCMYVNTRALMQLPPRVRHARRHFVDTHERVSRRVRTP